MRIDIHFDGCFETAWEGSPEQLAVDCRWAGKRLAALPPGTSITNMVRDLMRYGFPPATRARARVVAGLLAWSFAEAARAPDRDIGLKVPFDPDTRLRLDLRPARDGSDGILLTLQRTNYGRWHEPEPGPEE